MWNKPTPEDLAKVPMLYETEDVKLEDKIIHMHFFIGGSDWYIAEAATAGKNCPDGLMFGYAILGGDYEMSEWGYVSLEELAEVSVGGIEVDRDLHWTVRPANRVENICKGMGIGYEPITADELHARAA